MHQRIPSTRHQDVVDMSEETKIKVNRSVMCDAHKDENIKDICKDCKTCCTIHHRKCALVVEIESEIPVMKAELRRRKENLLKKQDEMKTHVGKQNSKEDEELAHYLQMESNIKSASLTAIEVIKAKERRLLSELKEMSDRHIEQLKADIKSGEMSVQMYQQQAELIDQALQSESDMDVYEMYQRREAGDVEAFGVVDVKEKGNIGRITFRQDTDKLSRALEDLPLGEIHVRYDDVPDLKAAPVLEDTINVTVPGDTDGGDPYDLTALKVNGTDTVVVTDSNNKCVKSFYTSNSQPGHSKLSLEGSPWGITRLKHNQVAVTVRETSQIVTVGVNPDLVLLSTITTSKQYLGITSLTSSTLAASSHTPVCIDILDMSGQVLKSVYPGQKDDFILKSPYFICTTRAGNILVSDWGTNSIVSLTPEGDLVFNNRPTGNTALTKPSFITTTSTGDILIMVSGFLIHLTESGQFVRYILTSRDGVMSPRGVCVGGRGRIYLSASDGVKVFTCRSE